MELVKAKIKIRCELGACKRKAAYSLHLARAGIRSRIHICKECLKEFYTLADREFNKNGAAKEESASGSIQKTVLSSEVAGTSGTAATETVMAEGSAEPAGEPTVAPKFFKESKETVTTEPDAKKKSKK